MADQKRDRGSSRLYKALAQGAYVGTGPWRGTVVSAHPGALNIAREDGLLVSIIAAEVSMTAMGILAVSMFEGLQLAGRSIQALVGRRAICRHSRLLIPGLAPIALPLGETWTGAIRRGAVRTISGEKSLLVEQTLAHKGNTAGLLGVLFPGAVQSIYAQQAIHVLAAGRLAELVGLGPGMTPAGDDFLAGALLAGTNTAEIEAALPGTTPAGRTLLWMALRGSFPFYLCSFMERLAGADSEEEIVEAVDAACSHGETSGTDALAGFCWMMRKRRESAVA